MKNIMFALGIIIYASLNNSCTFEVKTDNKTGTSSNSKIRNGIEIRENGLHVEQAFLLKDDGSLVGDDNKAQVGEKVSLRLIVKGWQVKDGKVFLEASEKVATNDGIVFLDEPALFSSSIPGGITPENAEAITLYATISKLDKLYDYFVVSFKVWDKTSNKSFTGSYKLHI